MRTYEAYCSACDRPVTVVPLSEFPEDEWPDDASEHSVVCVDNSGTCTGELCPLFEVPTERMRELYEREMEAGEVSGHGRAES